MPAAKLFGLDKERMAQAMGIAGVLAPIVNNKAYMSRSDVYHYQRGFTSRDGIVVALIGEKGDNTLRYILDGDRGFWSSVSDTCEWEWMIEGLSEKI